MTYINPVSGTAISAAVQQEQLSAQRSRQLQKGDALRRESADEADYSEPAVEQVERIHSVHDTRQQSDRKPHEQLEPDPGGAHPHIDLLG